MCNSSMRLLLISAVFCGLMAVALSADRSLNLQSVRNAEALAKAALAKKKEEDKRPWTAIAKAYYEKNKRKMARESPLLLKILKLRYRPLEKAVFKMFHFAIWHLPLAYKKWHRRKKGQSIKDFFINAEKGIDKKKKEMKKQAAKAKATVAKAKAAAKSAAKAAKKAAKGDPAAVKKAAEKTEKAKKTVAKAGKKVEKVKAKAQKSPKHEKHAKAKNEKKKAHAATKKAKKQAHKAAKKASKKHPAQKHSAKKHPAKKAPAKNAAVEAAVQNAATSAKAKLQALKEKMQTFANSIIAMLKSKDDLGEMRLEDLRALADGDLDMLLDSSYV